MIDLKIWGLEGWNETSLSIIKDVFDIVVHKNFQKYFSLKNTFK